MLRLFALLTGDRYNVIKQHGPASRKKVVAMGSGLLLVTGLWFVTGLNIGLNILSISSWSAIALAIGLGAVVLMVDRMILLGDRVKSLVAVARIVLAVGMSIFGSISLDLFILRSEIGQTLAQVHQEDHAAMLQSVRQQHEEGLRAARSAVEEASRALATAEADWKHEMDGSAGSGRYGVGTVARAKGQLVLDRKRDLEYAQERAEVLDDRIREEQRVKGAALTHAQRTGGIFERIHALHRYLHSDRMVMVGYVLLFLITLLVELSPLLAKSGFPRTAYEHEVEFTDRTQRERLDSMVSVQRQHRARITAMSAEERIARSRVQDITTAYRSMN